MWLERMGESDGEKKTKLSGGVIAGIFIEPVVFYWFVVFGFNSFVELEW